MVSNIRIGARFPAGAADSVLSDLSAAFKIDAIRVVTGGMEDAKSAYLILTSATDINYLLLDRHNDDGEYAPQLYLAPDDLDVTDDRSVLAAAAQIGNDVEALSDAELDLGGLVLPTAVDSGDVEDALFNALYNFRDLLRLSFG